MEQAPWPWWFLYQRIILAETLEHPCTVKELGGLSSFWGDVWRRDMEDTDLGLTCNHNSHWIMLADATAKSHSESTSYY